MEGRKGGGEGGLHPGFILRAGSKPSSVCGQVSLEEMAWGVGSVGEGAGVLPFLGAA